ncbi:toll/interleukin-1 receptor domain-containing protein [Prauserella sp. ASG 168]|uniref:Toll/interleukin-1 receptor domain-containing protein n=2 Tax=Prauserella cavernicola TaxID=2800127 RepID=A0A934QUC9_9PSEU|nr:toll/interleukin-1 receptor domain-containing protein [Prauserella cavernicola]
MRVFISYTHDDDQHREAVRELATLLVDNGIEVDLDAWSEKHRHDWYVWATRGITEADFVLVIASAEYRRMGDGNGPAHLNLGGQSEAALLRELVQSRREEFTKKILPVILPGHTVDEIPFFLQPYAATRYELDSITAEGAESLLRVIFGKPEHLPPPLGTPPTLPPRSGPGSPTAATRAPTWRPLDNSLPVQWRQDRGQGATVELHLVPVAPDSRLGVRTLSKVSDDLAARGRAQGLFSHDQALDANSNERSAWARTTNSRTGEAGLTVHRDGQLSCWHPLPTANIVAVLDEEYLTQQLATRLQLLLGLDLPRPREFAPAIGLGPAGFVHLGRLADASARTSFQLKRQDQVRIEPEEAISVDDLRQYPHKVADELVARIAQPFRR